jgi:uncharacterized integral membrane protein
MSTLKYSFFIALIIFVSLFAAKNMHTVEVYFFDSSSSESIIKVPTMVLISCAFGLGFLIAWFFELFSQLKLKAQIREKQKNIDKLEKDLSQLIGESEEREESQSPTPL